MSDIIISENVCEDAKGISKIKKHFNYKKNAR